MLSVVLCYAFFVLTQTVTVYTKLYGKSKVSLLLFILLFSSGKTIITSINLAVRRFIKTPAERSGIVS